MAKSTHLKSQELEVWSLYHLYSLRTESSLITCSTFSWMIHYSTQFDRDNQIPVHHELHLYFDHWLKFSNYISFTENKLFRPWWDASFCGISSGSSLFIYEPVLRVQWVANSNKTICSNCPSSFHCSKCLLLSCKPWYFQHHCSQEGGSQPFMIYADWRHTCLSGTGDVTTTSETTSPVAEL